MLGSEEEEGIRALRVDRTDVLPLLPKALLFLQLTCVSIALGACNGDERRLSPEQCDAIERARQFIADNGYTTAPPSTDPSRWRAEPWEERFPLDRVIGMRRGRLRPDAVGLLPGRGGNGEGWTVLFPYHHTPSGRRIEGWGRGVFVPPGGEGETPFMHQVEISFDDATVRLSSPEETAAECGWR